MVGQNESHSKHKKLSYSLFTYIRVCIHNPPGYPSMLYCWLERLTMLKGSACMYNDVVCMCDFFFFENPSLLRKLKGHTCNIISIIYNVNIKHINCKNHVQVVFIHHTCILCLKFSVSLRSIQLVSNIVLVSFKIHLHRYNTNFIISSS